MIEVEGQVKKWGNSFGVRMSRRNLAESDIREGETVRLLIAKKGNPVRETFGALKFKKSTEQMMREIDRDLWHD